MPAPPPSTTSRWDPSLLRRALTVLDERGDLRGIVRIVDAWESEAELDSRARLLQARAFLELAQPERAWGRVRELLARDPDDVPALGLLAEVFLARGWSARARGVVDRIDLLSPGSPRVARLKGRCAAPPTEVPSDADHVEARGDAAARLQLGRVLLCLGHSERALPLLARVAEGGGAAGAEAALVAWAEGGRYRAPGEGLAQVLAALALVDAPGAPGAEETVAARDALGADPETAEVSLAGHEAGMRASRAFPLLFRGVGPADDAEADEKTASAPMGAPAAAPFGFDADDDRGETQILQVIRGPGGVRVGPAEPSAEPQGRAAPGARPLDLRGWSSGRPRVEDGGRVVHTPRAAPVAVAEAPRRGPIEVVERVPVPDPLPVAVPGENEDTPPAAPAPVPVRRRSPAPALPPAVSSAARVPLAVEDDLDALLAADRRRRTLGLAVVFAVAFAAMGWAVWGVVAGR